jgi:hypothetical protein
MIAPLPGDLVWEASLPLLSGRVLGQWTKALLATAAIVCALLALLFGVEREWDAVGPIFLLLAGAVAALWVLGVAVMAVVFRGRYRVRYTASAEGLLCETVDKTARAANRIATAAGALTLRPQALGAGLVAASRESESVRWTGAFRADVDRRRSCITLRDAWRTLMHVQCTPENFPEVSAFIGARMAAQHTAERVPSSSPLPRYLLRTVVVVAATLPLFVAASKLDVGLLLPTLTLCFAVATIWLINAFGWVVLGGLACQIVLTAARLIEGRRSFYGSDYRAYEVLSGDDVALLVGAGLGAVLLGWMSWRAIRGRWPSALLEGGRNSQGR